MPIKKQLDQISSGKKVLTGNEEFLAQFRESIVNENSKFAMKSGRNFVSSNNGNDTCDV